MCGIFGYVGKRRAQPILIDGLRALEYRGYDSAGVFIPGLGSVKAVGPIDNLAARLEGAEAPGTAGIAHTRWATHGPPSEENAHPHSDAGGSIFVVHNGIIENYRELKDRLLRDGAAFTGDTDTEVLAKLIGAYYDGDLSAAVRRALGDIRGTYGLAVMSERDPDAIVVARLGSPIVLGLAGDGQVVASDPSAILPHTKEVIYLEDGELALVSVDSYAITDKRGRPARRAAETLDWDAAAAKKQGYPHFMLKEIREAPEVIRDTIRGRLSPKEGRAKLGGLADRLPELQALQHLTIAGCGSAYYAGYVGKYLLEEYAKLPVDIELGSEYRYKAKFKQDKSALLAVTQSGETADTLAAVRAARELGLLTLGMVNVVGSTIARETDAGVYNHAGPEVAVASTKAFLSQLAAFALLALLIARDRSMSAAEGRRIIAGLSELPDVLESFLRDTTRIQELAEKYARYDNIMYIGRKLSMPVAYEGALKLKEVAYIHAEAYAGGELKHGPIALLSADFPVVALAPQDDVYEKMLSNIEEVKARGAPVLALGQEGDRQLKGLADDVIELPRAHPLLQPIITTVPLHLLAYYAGVARGHNVDRPRNLAKSVTVE